MVWIVPALAWVLCNAVLLRLRPELEPRQLLELVLLGQLAAAATCGLVLLGGAAVLRHAPRPGLVAAAITAAAFAATPVGYEFDDGCSSHWGYTPAALAPYVTRGEDTRLSNGGIQSLMGCIDLSSRDGSP